MRRGQAHGLTVRDDAEDEDSVRDEGERHPELKHDEARALEELPVEGDVDGAEGLVAVTDEQARDAVDDEADDGERPEGPGQADILDHCDGTRS